MLRDPLAVQKILADHFGPKIFAKPKKTPLEPLDLLATVGQSCVCVCESVIVLVSVSVCLCVCGDKRRCGVVTLTSPKKLFPKKTHISLSSHLYLKSFSLSSINYYITIKYYIN